MLRNISRKKSCLESLSIIDTGVLVLWLSQADESSFCFSYRAHTWIPYLSTGYVYYTVTSSVLIPGVSQHCAPSSGWPRRNPQTSNSRSVMLLSSLHPSSCCHSVIIVLLRIIRTCLKKSPQAVLAVYRHRKWNNLWFCDAQLPLNGTDLTSQTSDGH